MSLSAFNPAVRVRLPEFLAATAADAMDDAAVFTLDAWCQRMLREHAFDSGSLIDEKLAQDGGDITFHGFDRGIVYLHMKGACAGCPSSTLTLKMGIENLLRHYIPEVTEVRPVAA